TIPAATTSPASTRRRRATTPSANSKPWDTTSPSTRHPDRAAHPANSPRVNLLVRFNLDGMASPLDLIDRLVGLAAFHERAQLGAGSRQHLGGGSQVDAAGPSVAGDQRPRADDAAARDPHLLLY